MTPREIYEALRYQLAPIGVTTIGPCAAGCRASSRGGQVCASCLALRLYAAGYTDAIPLKDALRASAHAILEAEQWLEQQEAAAMNVNPDELAELKPCPWCGEKLTHGAVIEGSTFRWRVLQGCCTDGPEVRYDTLSGDPAKAEAEARELAIAAWNERDPAITALERERDELRAQVEAMRRDAGRWREARRRYLTANHEAAIDAAMREGGDG